MKTLQIWDWLTLIFRFNFKNLCSCVSIRTKKKRFSTVFAQFAHKSSIPLCKHHVLPTCAPLWIKEKVIVCFSAPCGPQRFIPVAERRARCGN